MANQIYLAIDLKSFYASVECLERKLDPLVTNLVVADEARTEKTICLAVSPSLKAYGIPGRARLFEVTQKVQEINALRRRSISGQYFTNKSSNVSVLKANPTFEFDYIVATPQMAHYMEVSLQIYSHYLKFVSPDDIHVYSIDEVFINATPYLKLYNLSAHDFAMKLINEVFYQTGITATAGIGTNLYLSKIAMDIMAKHIPADKNGVRIAELDELEYRRALWSHQPLTDFWRIGRGYAQKLKSMGLYTMGDIARISIHNEDLLYKAFGVNAELLIDHSWGWESCTIKDIKAYKPEKCSLSTAQVLSEPYNFKKGRLVVMEMIDQLVLDLLEKGLVTKQLGLTVCYDMISKQRCNYSGPITTDRYGRITPKEAHGTFNLDKPTSSAKCIVNAMLQLFDRIVNQNLLIRRLCIAANDIENEKQISGEPDFEQLDLFTDSETLIQQKAKEKLDKEKEIRLQRTIIDIKKKFGKNAVLKCANLLDGSTAKLRNEQIGGHKK